MPAKDITLYAVYRTPIKARWIVVDTLAGTVVNPETVCYKYNKETSCKIETGNMTANEGYTVSGWTSVQGNIEVEAGNVVVQGPKEGKLKGGFTVDMSSFSDQALTLAAIAPFANAPITIKGIGHIRMQECDRIQAIVQNLTDLGIKVEEQEAEVTIYPGEVRGADIETFDDHRVAMSFALTGLQADGVKIINPMCCRKTFAEYFEVLEQIITQVTEV